MCATSTRERTQNTVGTEIQAGKQKSSTGFGKRLSNIATKKNTRPYPNDNTAKVAKIGGFWGLCLGHLCKSNEKCRFLGLVLRVRLVA